MSEVTEESSTADLLGLVGVDNEWIAVELLRRFGELDSKLTACEYSGKKLYREFEILENACEFWRKEAIRLGYKE